MMHDRLHADGGGQMRLAGARLTDERAAVPCFNELFINAALFELEA
jgi:hypothetical protein